MKNELTKSKKRLRKNFYDKDTGYAWFQSFIDKEGNNNNRIIVDELGQPYLQTHNGNRIPYREIEKQGYKPTFPIPNIEYKNKKGIAKFRFQKSEFYYRVIELFYNHVGPKNMNVIIQGNHEILVEVKPSLIKEILSEESLEQLKGTLIEGSISKRLDGFYIDSGLEILSIGVPAKLKNRIKVEAKKQKVNIEDVVVSILTTYYNNQDKNG
ncbi:hypothetical protein [Mesobacillus zeae]|uniref:hypothetical protein n=1 Tax=Mesobacillus zeae TaxID=1917180 RepID=UPI001FEA39AD|nr:hypothetical protein [Mesobacillus zeae]